MRKAAHCLHPAAADLQWCHAAAVPLPNTAGFSFQILESCNATSVMPCLLSFILQRQIRGGAKLQQYRCPNPACGKSFTSMDVFSLMPSSNSSSKQLTCDVCESEIEMVIDDGGQTGTMDDMKARKNVRAQHFPDSTELALLLLAATSAVGLAGLQLAATRRPAAMAACTGAGNCSPCGRQHWFCCVRVLPPLTLLNHAESN
jgi:hypothetical protein